jgi:hypothetical protein
MNPPTSTTDRPWGAAAWHRAKRQHPMLTSYGFGVPPGLADAWREGLDPEDLQQIATCGLFLAGLQQIEPGRRCPGSYALKHRIERWAGMYIREGALIAAAVALGVPLKRHGREHHGVQLGLAAASLAARLERPLSTLTTI